MLECLMNNPVVQSISYFIGIAGFIYAVYCQRKNTQKIQISYIIDTNTLIYSNKADFEKLKITYGDTPVNNFHVSRLTLWNSGNTVIENTDIVTGKELTISVCNDSKILDAKIVSETEQTNKFILEQVDERTVKILFDYMEKKNGSAIQIIHSGAHRDVAVTCKIKGGETLFNAKPNLNIPRFRVNRKVAAVLPLILSALMLLMLFGFAALSLLIMTGVVPYEILISQIENNPFNWGTTIISSIALLMYIFLFIQSIKLVRKEFKVGIPAALKENFSHE